MKRRWAAFALLAAAGAVHASPEGLAVCADPSNLPFSNRALQGFENKIVALVARDLRRPVHYVWWPQQRGYVRKTLNASMCDIWPGIATEVNKAATTRAYYRSTYVFVTRTDAALRGLTLDDPRLKKASIGVQMIGNDAMNTPPAHAIAQRGLIYNVRGYMIYGNYGRADSADAIIQAVADKQIDVAIVWGPVAGYYADRSKASLRINAVTPSSDAQWPMSYDISMGVRHGNETLLAQLNAVLGRERAAIESILNAYHVPLVCVRCF